MVDFGLVFLIVLIGAIVYGRKFSDYEGECWKRGILFPYYLGKAIADWVDKNVD